MNMKKMPRTALCKLVVVVAIVGIAISGRTRKDSIQDDRVDGRWEHEDMASEFARGPEGEAVATAMDVVAKIGTTGYATLGAAVAAAENGDTIVVCADLGDIDIDIGKTITLDATGYTVTGKAKTCAIRIVDGSLTIAGGNFRTEETTAAPIFLVGDREGNARNKCKSGSLVVNGGTFGGYKASSLVKNIRGVVVVNGGTFTNTTGRRGLTADGPAAMVTINNGMIDCTGKAALVADRGGTVNVNGGTVAGSVVSAGGAASSITVNGGLVAGALLKSGGTISVPVTSTARFNADLSAFCTAGYEMVADPACEGWYMVHVAAINVTPEITLSSPGTAYSDGLTLPAVMVDGYESGMDYEVAWNGELPAANPAEDVVLTVTVRMKGKYAGSGTATFMVRPAVSADPTYIVDDNENDEFDKGVSGDDLAKSCALGILESGELGTAGGVHCHPAAFALHASAL